MRRYRINRPVSGSGVRPVLAARVSALLLLLTAAAPGAETNRIETWDGGTINGWKRQDTLSGNQRALTNVEQSLSIPFDGQSMPTPAVDLVYADDGASQGWLTGDYVAAGVKRIRFKILCADLLPDQARLYFEGGTNNNRWYCPVAGLKTGEWLGVDVPLDYDQGWRVGTDPTREKFTADLQSVAWMGLRLQRNSSTNAQTYRLDDVLLEGEISGPFLPALPDWWLQQYFPGREGTPEASPGADPDTDGMNNYAEYVAGTDPTNNNSLLQVWIGLTNLEGRTSIMLQWLSVTNRLYTVDRAVDLIRGFLGLESNIPGAPPVNLYEDNTGATNAGPYFYRIRVRQ